MDFTTALTDADKTILYQRSIASLEEEIRATCLLEGIDADTLADPYTAEADSDGVIKASLKQVETLQARWNDLKTKLAALG